MLIIAVLMLLLVVTSSIKRDSEYLVEYVKLNRIVLTIFILSAYIAYNTLDIDMLTAGFGIYGGVFKITNLSQVFDIILFLTGAIVTILTCFVPYNIIKYDRLEWMQKIKNKENTNIKLNERKEKLEENRNSFFKLIENNISNILKTSYILENNLKFNRLEVKEYSFLLLYTIIGGSLLISSCNLISLYLSLELQSFTLYILSTSQIRSFKGTSGGLKYFLLGGFSSSFILLGCSLLYAYTGTLNFEFIFMIYSDNVSNYYLDLCLLILFAGLLFKVSAAPFHNWAPDVYSDVPTYSTTWLIVIAKLSVLVLMLILIHNIHSGLNLNNLNVIEQSYSFFENNNSEVLYNNYINLRKSMGYLYIDNNVDFSFWNPSYSSLGLWTNVLTFSAFLSLIIGTVLGLSQSRIKRLFAYSTIAHIGFLLLALSLNSITSIDAFIFYLIQYTITNLNLFFILVAWGYLYSRYYLDNDFLPVKYLDNYYLQKKDIYCEPTIYDFFETIYDKYLGLNEYWDKLNSNKKIKINTIYNYYLLQHDLNYYDLNSEENDWLYTPVPFLTNLKGMYKRDPFLAFCLAISIFSLAGIPPLIGFFAKQQVLLASMQLDYYFLSIVIIITSVIGAAYYLRIIKFIYFYDDVFMPFFFYESSIENENDKFLLKKTRFTLETLNSDFSLAILPSNNLSLVIAFLTNFTLFYFIKPYVFINIIHMITLSLFQN